jgi:hypothetical protein
MEDPAGRIIIDAEYLSFQIPHIKFNPFVLELPVFIIKRRRSDFKMHRKDTDTHNDLRAFFNIFFTVSFSAGRIK